MLAGRTLQQPWEEWIEVLILVSLSGLQDSQAVESDLKIRMPWRGAFLHKFAVCCWQQFNILVLLSCCPAEDLSAVAFLSSFPWKATLQDCSPSSMCCSLQIGSVRSGSRRSSDCKWESSEGGRQESARLSWAAWHLLWERRAAPLGGCASLPVPLGRGDFLPEQRPGQQSRTTPTASRKKKGFFGIIVVKNIHWQHLSSHILFFEPRCALGQRWIGQD